jgi:hypothetical protein
MEEPRPDGVRGVRDHRHDGRGAVKVVDELPRSVAEIRDERDSGRPSSVHANKVGAHAVVRERIDDAASKRVVSDAAHDGAGMSEARYGVNEDARAPLGNGPMNSPTSPRDIPVLGRMISTRSSPIVHTSVMVSLPYRSAIPSLARTENRGTGAATRRHARARSGTGCFRG